MAREGSAIFDPEMTAQAMLAYLEGVLLLAKSHNNPELIKQLRFGMLSLLHSGRNSGAH
jgi:hypothetical protein